MNRVDFDIIVVGAGHAGIEAALASSRLGLSTLLVTSNGDRIGYMSCNPSIGGLAKGHMVRELDALGGEMPVVADKTCIQFKRLNSSKGPAVRGSRAQCDKDLYCLEMGHTVRSAKGLRLIVSEAKSLILEGNTCCGIVLEDGSRILSRSVVITTGTFMNGVMHVGLRQYSGGRVGDKATVGLSDQLKNFGFEVRRLKTGTPARLHKDSIDWSKTTAEYGDEKFYPFSFKSSDKHLLPQIPCYISYTTEETHEVIRRNLDKSPMYCGIIEGVGPRYCPSIEDKVTRFAERPRHQTFLEPEGLNTDLIYLQGMSTSLPEDVQDRFLKTIPGLENVKVIRYGYAVEYDFIEPTQLFHTLETRGIQNLFLAGQINGTSGYEEAAVQGFMAGVNASHKLLGREAFVLRRDQAYIGVLVDDLVTKGTSEPYRMFTSRAEHRLVLREDNVYDRLVSIGHGLGLVSDQDFAAIQTIQTSRNLLLERLKSTRITPTVTTQEVLSRIPTPPLLKSISMEELMRRDEVRFFHLKELGFDVDEDPRVLESVEIDIRYTGYVRRQMELIEMTKKFENMKIPSDFDYGRVRGLSAEEVEKLSRIRPVSLGQAQRISGVNPSAIQGIMIYLRSMSR